MNKLFLFIIMFLLSFSFVNAEIYTQIYSEIFNYNDAFTNHGWNYLNGGCGASSNLATPINSKVFGGNAFGHNTTNGCAFSFSRTIKRNLPVNISEGYLRHTYRMALINDTTETANVPYQISFINYSGGGSLTFRHYKSSLNVSITGFTGSTNCGYNITTPYNLTTAQIDINLDTQTYTWTLNNLIICENIVYSTVTNHLLLNEIRLTNQLDTSEYLDVETTELRFFSADSELTIYGLNEPCNSDDDCLSGKCEFGYCVLKLGKDSCTDDTQCISGNCIGGKCSKPSLWQLINAGKNEQFGNDSDTNNFLALLLAIGLPCIILWLGHKSRLVVVSAIGLMIALMFFFTIIGWLSFFITFGAFITIIIVFFILLMFGGGSK